MACGGCRKNKARFRKKIEAMQQKAAAVLGKTEPEKTPRQERIEARKAKIKARNERIKARSARIKARNLKKQRQQDSN